MRRKEKKNRNRKSQESITLKKMGSKSKPSSQKGSQAFGDGLDFGAFSPNNSFGDASGKASSSSDTRRGSRSKSSKTTPRSSADAFGFDDDDDPFNIGGGSVTEKPINFGDDSFMGNESITSHESYRSNGTSRSGNTRSSSRSDRSSDSKPKVEAWKLRESWKNSSRSHSSSASNPSRARGARRLPPRSKSHQGEELFDEQDALSPVAPRSRRLPARSKSHQGEEITDNPLQSHSPSTSSADTNPTPSRRKAHKSPSRSRSERSPTRKTSPVQQEGERQRAPPGRTRSGMRSRRAAGATATSTDGPEAGEETEARPLRSRRRAAPLAYGSSSDGQMEPVERAPTLPRRNKSVDETAAPSFGNDTTARQRTRRRASVSNSLEAPGGFDPMQMNLPPPDTKAPQKDFMRDRSKNQQRILDMAKSDKTSQTPSANQISIETIPDALGMGSNQESSGKGGLGIGKMIRKATGTSKSKEKQAGLEDAQMMPGMQHDPNTRQRRGLKGKSKKDKSKEEDYTERRDIEGRNQASLLERVTGGEVAGHEPRESSGGGGAMSYSERIMMAQQQGKRG